MQQAIQLLCLDLDRLWTWKMKWDHNALALDHAAVLFLRIIGPTRQRKKLEGASEPFYPTVGYQVCSGAIAMFVMDQHAFFLHRTPT